jgi:hypothetical protein
MASTNLQLNWTSVSFASTNITRVTSVNFALGGELISFSGDNDRYPRVIANNVNRPRCSITSGDPATLYGFTPGQSGAILATQLDALGATGGAINWQMLNAVHENSDDIGQWGQFGSGTATFQAFSSDGATNPLSIASRS